MNTTTDKELKKVAATIAKHVKAIEKELAKLNKQPNVKDGNYNLFINAGGSVYLEDNEDDNNTRYIGELSYYNEY